MAKTPTVFLSHSSDDKERFVEDLATRLRAKGVDVWLDKWEMLPGDSLIDKIFEEGLKNADVFLIVLSMNSINSNWVKKELNTAQVKQIAGKCRIVPVVIDKVVIPESLAEFIYQNIADVNSYDDEFARILATIYDHREKPPLGEQPPYAKQELVAPSGLTELDYFLLNQVFEYQLVNETSYPYTEDFLDKAEENGWSRSDAGESFVTLCEKFYLQGHSTLDRSRTPMAVHLTDYGWETMFSTTRKDYFDLLRKLAVRLVNTADDHNGKDGETFAEYLGESRQLTLHLLDALESRNFIKISKSIGRHYYVTYVSPQLKRALQGGAL